jgi:hypothetical protein
VLTRDGAVLWCSPSGEQLEMSFDSRYLIERREGWWPA